MVKQMILVLNHSDAKLTQGNIADMLGPKWAWKFGKLAQAVWFVEGDWQDMELRDAVAEHNFKVQVRWLSGGGDPARKFWWHVTEVTLDHLRPSPRWQKEMAELQLAKECEAAIRHGLRELAERRKREAEKRQMLLEALEDLEKSPPLPVLIPRWGNPQRNVKLKEVGFLSRPGTEPLKRSIIVVPAPGAKGAMLLARIASPNSEIEKHDD